MATVMLDTVQGSFTLKSHSSFPPKANSGRIYWVSDKSMDFFIGLTESDLWIVAHRMGWIVNFGG